MSQAGSKIAGRNINNFRYADDTTLMAENEKELKNLLMRVKEESEKAGLKLNIKKKKALNLDSVLKSRDITLLTEVHIVKTMIFPVACTDMCWTIKKPD